MDGPGLNTFKRGDPVKLSDFGRQFYPWNAPQRGKVRMPYLDSVVVDWVTEKGGTVTSCVHHSVVSLDRQPAYMYDGEQEGQVPPV